jgi:hypothetical protein
MSARPHLHERKFRIGFPVDGGTPELSFIVLIQIGLSKYHTCKGGEASALRANSGAAFVFERVPEDIRERYRFEFEPVPIGNTKTRPDNLTDVGYSDAVACALSIAKTSSQYNSSQPEKTTPLILLSCSFQPHEARQGLTGLLLEKVTNHDLAKSRNSLYNKWRAACQNHALALVLHREDAKVLNQNFSAPQFPLTKTIFVELLGRNFRETPVVSCEEDQLALLAEALCIAPHIFLATPGKDKHRMLALLRFHVVVSLFLLSLVLWMLRGKIAYDTQNKNNPPQTPQSETSQPYHRLLKGDTRLRVYVDKAMGLPSYAHQVLQKLCEENVVSMVSDIAKAQVILRAHDDHIVLALTDVGEFPKPPPVILAHKKENAPKLEEILIHWNKVWNLWTLPAPDTDIKATAKLVKLVKMGSKWRAGETLVSMPHTILKLRHGEPFGIEFSNQGVEKVYATAIYLERDWDIRILFPRGQIEAIPGGETKLLVSLRADTSKSWGREVAKIIVSTIPYDFRELVMPRPTPSRACQQPLVEKTIQKTRMEDLLFPTAFGQKRKRDIVVARRGVSPLENDPDLAILTLSWETVR